nr:phosphatidylinositol 4-kinase [Babesia microti]
MTSGLDENQFNNTSIYQNSPDKSLSGDITTYKICNNNSNEQDLGDTTLDNANADNAITNNNENLSKLNDNPEIISNEVSAIARDHPIMPNDSIGVSVYTTDLNFKDEVVTIIPKFDNVNIEYAEPMTNDYQSNNTIESQNDSPQENVITDGVLQVNTPKKSEPLVEYTGSLLRLFQSEYFDSFFHMYYLFSRKEPGIHEYLVNLLYSKRTEEEIHFYLPQLCQIALTKYKTSSLTRFLLDKASLCMHFALQVSWLFNAVSDDRISELEAVALMLSQETEMAVVNCKPTLSISSNTRPSDNIKSPDLFERHLLLTRMYNNSGISNRSKSPSSARIPEPFKMNTLPITIPNSVVKIPSVYSKLGNPLNVLSFQLTDYSDEIIEELQILLMKQRRCEYFNTLGHFATLCIEMSSQLCNETNRSLRLPLITRFFMALNEWMLLRRCAVAVSEGMFFYTGLTFPFKTLSPKPGNILQILRIVETEGKVFFSKTRAPFIMVLEVADLDEDVNSISEFIKAPIGTDVHLLDIITPKRNLTNITQSNEHLNRLKQEHFYVLKAILDDLFERKLLTRNSLEQVGGDYIEAIKNVLRMNQLDDEPLDTTLDKIEANLRSDTSDVPSNLTNVSIINNESSDSLSTNSTSTNTATNNSSTKSEQQKPRASTTPLVKFPIDLPLDTRRSSSKPSSPSSETISESLTHEEMSGLSTQQLRNYFWGETLEEKKKKFREQSPYGKLKTWDMRFIIVKAKDNSRQERLTLQIIEQFKTIFDKAKLPLWLRPYEILITGSQSGMIEFLVGTCSVDFLKRKFKTDSIAKVFDVAFKDCKFEAKKNFIESHAAYSLVSYFLQIKDRHNGNMLIDTNGHVIHIDFGFMLSNSPGNINFENAPFKLTQEYLDIMDGEYSDNFEYFRTLIIRGFLEARKHVDRIVLMIEMMTNACKLPCMSGGLSYIIEGLRNRFMVNIPEDACIEKIVEMIDMSINNFRTIQYDNYQRITNGIR